MRILLDYEGRAIRLTAERRAHIPEHPEMRALEPAMELALARPERVITPQSDPAVRLYYRDHPDMRVGGKYLCVVVKALRGDAFVVTAYLTDSIKRGVPTCPIAH